MSDKKISGSHLYSQSPNEKTDDLKSLFISKISSTEWASILIKKFCEEDVKNVILYLFLLS